MKSRHSYRWLIWILLAIFLIGIALYHILSPYLDRMQARRDYHKLAEDYVTVGSEDDDGDDQEKADSEAGRDSDDGKQQKKDWWLTDVKVEFDALKAKNPDIIAWIRFDHQDEIGISYPVVYSGDNEKYLRKDIYGNKHIAGSVFLEGLNQSDFSDLYNIIYGHNMNDGSMFGDLKKYKDEGFWEENQYFTIYTESTVYRYQIFSYEDAVNGGNVYKVGYQPGDEYQDFIHEMVENSVMETGIKPQSTNKILTLSTCTGNGYSKRFAVHAVCIDTQTTDETKLKEVY